jgi:hypothetical protein
VSRLSTYIGKKAPDSGPDMREFIRKNGASRGIASIATH